MQYNDTSGIGIIQTEEQMCRLGETGISSNTALLKQFTSLNNRAVDIIHSAIRKVSKNYPMDDLNYTNIPDAPIAIVENQYDYRVPVSATGLGLSTFAGIRGIYREQNGERIYLDVMEPGDIFSGTAAIPTKYRTDGGTIFFNCPFSAAARTLFGGELQVEFNRSPSYFVYTDETKEPGFMSSYHDLVPQFASGQYMLPIDTTLAREYLYGMDPRGEPSGFYPRLKELQEDIIRLNPWRPKLSAGSQNNH